MNRLKEILHTVLAVGVLGLGVYGPIYLAQGATVKKPIVVLDTQQIEEMGALMAKSKALKTALARITALEKRVAVLEKRK